MRMFQNIFFILLTLSNIFQVNLTKTKNSITKLGPCTVRFDDDNSIISLSKKNLKKIYYA